jgi:hypothetical protein
MDVKSLADAIHATRDPVFSRLECEESCIDSGRTGAFCDNYCQRSLVLDTAQSMLEQS